jgi:rhamnosyltransferase subunit B
MLALALEFKRRGYAITVASTEYYRGKVEGLGISFCGLRPDWDPTNHELIARCEDLRSGPEVLFRELILPHLRPTYDDLLAAASEADLMIAGELVYAAPLVAEKLGLKWASVILSPTSFFSAHDPSLLVNIPEAYRLRRAGWIVNRTVLEIGKLVTRRWWRPVRELRRQLGLRVACDPVFRDKFSRDLVLALFSPALAATQPDWPQQTIQPGFVFFDQRQKSLGESDELAEFMAGGEAPIVFTLGSTAVSHPGDFFPESLAAARMLGRRAVMVGAKPGEEFAGEDVFAVNYAPYSEVFPRSAIVVHQGGSGTTGQALRAGRPQLIVPYGWDQPDNGVRVERLGAGLCVARSAYSRETAAFALKRLLNEERFSERATQIGLQVLNEDGLSSACDAVEAIVSGQAYISDRP